NGAIVPGATITVTNTATGQRRQATTNDEGSFTVPLLPPSTYVVRAERDGFAPLETRDVVLNVGDRKALQIQLKAGDINAQVQVTSEAPLINESPAVATTIDRQFVANLPLNGRSFQSLILLTPGVVIVPSGTGVRGEFSVNGQRTEANYFTVDGVSANTGAPAGSLGGAAGFSGSTPSGTAVGTTQSLVSIDALQEFRIQTSSYSAEYGRSPGAQISLSTRAGTNDFHGSAFDYVRNEVFNANNWFNNASGIGKTPERQNDFGGTFGGPVIIPRVYNGRNKTFFFFSYEGLRLVVPAGAVTRQYPSMALRQSAPAAIRTILNAWPVPNGPDLGNGLAVYTAAFSNPSNVDATSIRIDHRFNDNFTIFGRYSDSPSVAKSRVSNVALVNNYGFRVKSLTIGTTKIFSAATSNDFRVNYTQNTGSSHQTFDTFGGAQPFDPSAVLGPLPEHFGFNFSLNFGGSPSFSVNRIENAQRQWNITDTLGISMGDHSLKFGFDFRRLSTFSAQRGLGQQFSYFSQNDLLQNNAPSARVFTDALVPPTPIYTNFSAFAQDDWKVNRRLTLALGLRWEVNPPPGEANGNLPYTLNQIADLRTAQLAPQGTPLWETTYGNFAPRFGAAYMLRQAAGRETVLRGGFGVFYDLGNNTGSAGFGGIGFFTRSRLSNVSIPLNASQLTLSPPSVASPYDNTVYAFDPRLRLPYTLGWNVAVEQSLGKNQTLTASYVGAAARRLLVSQFTDPSALGNANFSDGWGVQLTSNRATSDYHSLQAQFQRRLSRGLQALVSYTWAHAIDDASNNIPILSDQLLRGNADFDIRHNLQAAVTYDIPGRFTNGLARAFLSDWSLDGRFMARSGLPFDVISGNILDPIGNLTTVRANLVPGVPIYVSDPAAPGGRLVNFAAFTNPTPEEIAAGSFGNAPRNFVRGFAAWQVDLALRRQFSVGERLKVQLRGEAFNIFNHPNFGAVGNYLSAGPSFFGRAQNTLNSNLGGLNALYQMGGPRSLQFSLRLSF
ncbi:MAG TPA: carboxypeptidase regulatory-like domain-containing protein, partial [Pyrinomonadaceae bacterium]